MIPTRKKKGCVEENGNDRNACGACEVQEQHKIGDPTPEASHHPSHSYTQYDYSPPCVFHLPIASFSAETTERPEYKSVDNRITARRHYNTGISHERLNSNDSKGTKKGSVVAVIVG